ncbi:ROK family protein [Myxococcus hansupus]|uniref:ROK family protein n=1 Tax=Pseudomyxococcus hansupus TaxID=1297742 RepID=UPI000B3113AF|nr:ROK family protein [Myxococcus hansupus]
MPDWDVRRRVPPGVSALEVWNLPVQGRELWELLGAPRVEADQREGITGPKLAGGLRPALAEALAVLTKRHAVDAVWLSGGLVCLEGFGGMLVEASMGLPCPVYMAEEPIFAPVRAGLRLLEPLRPAHPVALDVGQTSIKCLRPAAAPRIFERDAALLPRYFIGMARPADGRQVKAAVAFISSALRAFSARAPDALCLALPCPLDAALVPGGSTYGWEGHAPLVADILQAAMGNEGRGTALVLNDAELAAEAARSDARLARHGRVLCLTLGFGPGAALLERR